MGTDDTDGAVLFSGDGIALSAADIGAKITALAATGSIAPDAYSTGGSVAELEVAAAAMLGKEAGLWMPTGTMANLLGVYAHCSSSSSSTPRVIVPQESHIYHDTGDGVSRLLSLTCVPLGAGRACFTAAEAEAAIQDGEVGGRVRSAVGALVIESPVRRRHGECVALEEMRQITAVARAAGIGCHLDGARLHMMANNGAGVSVSEYAGLFDTVYLDFHKYFGAPWGAMLLGPAKLVKPLVHERRMLGGACTNASLGAALALEGMKTFPVRGGFARTCMHVCMLYRSPILA
jgi:threonine aldolase